MLNKMRCVLAVLLAAGLAMPPGAVAQTATLLTPANTSTTYNNKPWITFSGTAGGGASWIQNAIVDVCNSASCSDTPPSDTCSASKGVGFFNCMPGDTSCNGTTSHAGLFYPINSSNNGAKITFRVPCALNAGTWYVQVSVYDDKGQQSSFSTQYSFTVANTPGWNQTVTAGKSLIRVGDFTELRTYIVKVRAARGYGAATYSNTTLAAGKVIHAVDITQMQSAFDTPFVYVTGSHIYSGSFISGQCGLTTIPCDINSTFNTVTSGTTKIRACHVNDIRTLFTNCSP